MAKGLAIGREAPALLAGAVAACALCILAWTPTGFLVPGAPASAPGLRGADPRAAAAPRASTFSSPGASHLSAIGVGFLAALAVAVRCKRAKVTRRSAEGEGEGEWKGAEAVSGLTGSVPLVFDSIAISKILPHRYPFLLVDKVIEFEAGKKIVGVKNVTANEPQFTGHFPDRPIMPGVLMVEAMAQLGGLVCLQQPISDGKGDFFFAGIDGVKFRKPVVPGDTLVMEMELKKFREKYGIAKMTGKAYVDGKLAVEVKEFTFAMVKE